MNRYGICGSDTPLYESPVEAFEQLDQNGIKLSMYILTTDQGIKTNFEQQR